MFAPLPDAPPEGGDTIEAWVWRYIASEGWTAKLAPGECPKLWSTAPPAPPRSPGRGEGFEVAAHADKSTGKLQLRSVERRARLMHSFLHHELQAAELMGWALLRFVDAPPAFRIGLLRILHDEVRHMNHYADYLRGVGYEPGAFRVRDWFWERVPNVTSPAAFCAVMGIGFEGGNLDHATRFQTRFRAAGDLEAARICALVAEEEIPHVRFAIRWFERWTRDDEGTLFEKWRAALPAPLSPILMRGDPIERELRRRAKLPDTFVDALAAHTP